MKLLWYSIFAILSGSMILEASQNQRVLKKPSALTLERSNWNESSSSTEQTPSSASPISAKAMKLLGVDAADQPLTEKASKSRNASRSNSWVSRLFRRKSTNPASPQIIINEDEHRKPEEPTLLILTSPHGTAKEIGLASQEEKAANSAKKVSKLLGEDPSRITVSHRRTSSMTVASDIPVVRHSRKISSPPAYIPDGPAAQCMQFIDDNNIDFIKAYLARNIIDINEPVLGYGQSPFYRAVEQNRTEIVELMADYNPDFAKKNEMSGKTPLDLIRERAAESIMYCIANNDIALAHWYVTNGIVDCMQPVPGYGKSPWEYAKELNRQEILAAMSPHNTPLSTTRNSGESSPSISSPLSTPRSYDRSTDESIMQLMRAIDENNIDVVTKILEQNHLDINTAVDDYHRQTPLYRAVEQNRTEIAKLLMNHGAHYLQKNELTEKTPLDRAIELYNRTPILTAILAKLGKEEVNALDENGETLLYRAVRSDNQDAVKLLLEKGASPNIANLNKTTPLMLATKSCLKHVMQLLIKYKAPLDAQDKYGWTALMWAAKHKKNDCTHILLKAGANAQIRSYDYKTVADLLMNENDLQPEDKKLSQALIYEEAARRADKTFLSIDDGLQRKSILEAMVKNMKRK